MDNSTITALTHALDFGSARLQALSNNLTNINTPGYKRKDVSFDALLSAAQGNESNHVSLACADPRHMSLDGDADALTPTITTPSSSSMRVDGNNVDVDSETARLAATQIYYEGAAQMLQGAFANEKYAISGGR